MRLNHRRWAPSDAIGCHLLPHRPFLTWGMQSIGRTLGLISIAIAFVSCESSGRWRRSDYRLSHGSPMGDAEWEPVSQRVFLIADNQRHDVLGGDVELYRTGAADRIVPLAIRPPQLDYFGQEFLRLALGFGEQAGVVGA